MIKIASQALGAISDFLQEHPKTTMGLLGGGLGALGGALVTGDGEEDETPEERTQRRLKNALILGGMGAGAGALLGAGAETLNSAIPASISTPEEMIGALGNPALVGSVAAAGGAIGGNALQNAVQSDLKTKVRMINEGLSGTKLPIPEKATMSEIRAAIPELLNSVKGNTLDKTKLLNSLYGHFHVAPGDAVELAKKLQHYGISTAALEETLPKAFEGVEKGTWNLMKFLRRNKYTAGAAALAGLGAAGLASSLRD